MKKRGIAMFLSMVMGLSAVLSGCGGEEDTPKGKDSEDMGTVKSGSAADEVDENAESAKDTLTIRIPVEPGSLDYHYDTTYAMYELRDWVTNGLLDQERQEDGNIISVTSEESLAESYEFDEDNNGITFKLRQGVKFHNGAEMTSADVKFSCDLYSDIPEFSFVDFANIETADDYTIHIPFKEKNANALYMLGIELPIYCESYYDEMGGEENDAEFYSTKMVGTGPYKVNEWVSGDYITFVRNDDYFAGTPKIANITCRIIYENSVALMELESGGIDVMIEPSWNEVKAVTSGTYGDTLTVWKDNGVSAAQLGFNMGSGKVQDIRVRQAICYAIDKATIAAGAYEGIGEDLYGIVSKSYENVKDYSDSWPYEYNPEKAKELLKEAGYEDGLDLIMILGGDTNRETAAEIMKNQLSEVGINMEIQSMDGATVVAKMANETDTWDLYIRNWGRPANPYVYFTSNLQESVHCDLDSKNEQMVLEANAFKSEMDEAARKELWGNFQDKYLTEYLYSYPLVQIMDYTILTSNLKGMQKVSFQTFKLKDAYFVE